jgi:MSHA pilin protein MshA
MRKINKQAGFTLIELIMVIVILGVLSAFALPRFADLGGDARTSSIKGLAGAIKAAANIAHAQQLANGASGATGVTLDSTAIVMIVGYPTADEDGIGEAAQISSDDYSSSGDGALAASTIVYSLQTDCTVSYTPTDAVVVTTVSGC